MDYASCKDQANASAVLFGVNTKTASHSESHLKHIKMDRQIFSGDFIRQADNVSPALPQNLLLGDKLYDAGNVSIESHTQIDEITLVKEQYINIFKSGQRPIAMGGDHILKYAAFSAASECFSDCGIVYIDAHPDCQVSEDINFYSILHHAFKLPHISKDNVNVVGLRQINQVEAEGMKHHQLVVTWATDFIEYSIDVIYQRLKKQFQHYKHVYFSIDLDGLNPASAPAVEQPYPGGPGIEQILVLLRKFSNDFKLIGLDVTEFVPEIDSACTTALTAAGLIKEFYSLDTSAYYLPNSTL